MGTPKKHEFFFEVDMKCWAIGFAFGYDANWKHGWVHVAALCFNFGYRYEKEGE